MPNISFYEEAHIFTSALRILFYRTKKTPTIKELADFLDYEIDHISLVCKKLNDLGIVKISEGSFNSDRIQIDDHLKIEDLPKEVTKSSIKNEIDDFQKKSKNDLEEKVKSLISEKKKKEKDLFDELEKKFKKKN